MTETSDIINTILPDIYVNPDMPASRLIKDYWAIYQATFGSVRSLNGSVFEALISITLIRAGILPFYRQAKITFIPNVDYDFVIYTEEIGPIVLSAKTSIRERYKQADLEGYVLRNIHRKAETYLVSMSAKEVQTRKANLDDTMAINNFILATATEYDELIDYLKTFTIIEAPTINVISSGNRLDKTNLNDSENY